jgi:succinoglycan biosynthesis transport protein ExoP
MEEIQIHALDYLSVLQRRKWWLVVPAVLSVFVGLALVRYLPKEYRSSTTLGVSAPMVSPALVNPSASFDNEERLRAISQQLLSVPILDRVVTEEKLQSDVAKDVQIGRLRRAIEIYAPPTVPGAETRRFDTFIVSYSDEDPARAQRITNRLARVFVDENSRSRTERAEDTSAFISTELQASKVRLTGLEARLRQAKEAYMGQLPEQTPANLQMLGGLHQQLEANATAFRGEQDRLTMIERQITALRQGQSDVQLLARIGGGGPSSAQSRVNALERELTAAQMQYTDKHPEIQRVRTELAQAKREAAAEAERGSEEASKVEADPIYRQLMADRETTERRIQELQRAARDVQAQITRYQARVEAAPMVEQQLATVQRDFDLERQQYAELSNKLRTSSIAESVERNRSGEQFTVLYSASYPSTPTKPVLWRVMFMSIMSGICLGIALVFGCEYFDRSVHDIRQLRDEFNLPVLGEVTRIQPIVRQTV